MIDQSNEQHQTTQFPHAFNPNDHLIKLKSRGGSKDYLPVQWRLAWFREQCPHGTIETEMIHLDLDRETNEEMDVVGNQNSNVKAIKRAKGFAIFRAVVKDGKGGVATGTKSEQASSFPDYIEKAETGAIGRALAALGFGTQFAPELSEEHRIVDAPVTRNEFTNGNGRMYTPQAAGDSTNSQMYNDVNASASEQQISSIRKLSEYLGKAEPESLASMSNLEAKKVIQQLTAEYRQSKKAS